MHSAAEACRAAHPQLAGKLATFESPDEMQEVLSLELHAPTGYSYKLGLNYDAEGLCLHQSETPVNSHRLHLQNLSWHGLMDCN